MMDGRMMDGRIMEVTAGIQRAFHHSATHCSAFRLFVFLILGLGVRASAGPLDELALDRWAKLSEVERYQLQIAERYHKQQNWKAALAEYEKFVTLYERSEGASYAQLKWGLCQVQLRQANTAIKDGFQSVIDYWPESPDAILARYYIGRTYKDMGQVDKAKKAYEGLLKDHLQHPVAAHALGDLVDIAQVEKDFKARAEYWKKLTFDVKRTEATDAPCRQAAKQYAQWCFGEGVFDEGAKALATTYAGPDLPTRVAINACPALAQMAAEAATRPKAERMATQAVSWLRQQGPPRLETPEHKELLRKTLFAVAEVHAAALQDTQTAAVYDEIVRRCGVSDETLGRRGAWHETRSKFDDAYKVYRQFAKKPDGLARVASSYRQRRLYPAAVGIYHEIIGLDAANQVRWTVEIAATHREARQYAEAIKVYRELLKNDPTNTQQWLWNIGITHRDAGQWKEAIGILRQCTNFPDNFMVMASCHRNLKEYREALLLYNQIGADEQHAPWAALQIGLTWEEAGKKEEAIKALQQVCKRFPKSSSASTAHARLQDVYKISVTLGGATDQ
jgi:tetratricopeptide (TPR) repeat protein